MQQKKNEKDDESSAGIDIGSLLLNSRESIGVPLESAAKAVNLSASIIERLESNQFSQIGKNVYIRGYLGLYSKYLGLDVAQMINVYDSQYPAEPVAIRSAIACQYDNKKQMKQHSKTFSFLLAASVFFVLVYGYKRFEPTIFDVSKKNDEMPGRSASEGKSPVDVIVGEVEGARVIADDALSGVSVATQESELVSELNLNDFESVLGAGFTDQRQANAVVEVQGDEFKTKVEQSVDFVESNDSRLVEKTMELQVGKLELNFKDECWLELKDATGEVYASGIYSSRRSVKVSGKLPFALTTARKSAVKRILLNGEAVKLDSYKVGKRRYLIK